MSFTSGVSEQRHSDPNVFHYKVYASEKNFFFARHVDVPMTFHWICEYDVAVVCKTCATPSCAVLLCLFLQPCVEEFLLRHKARYKVSCLFKPRKSFEQNVQDTHSCTRMSQ